MICRGQSDDLTRVVLAEATNACGAGKSGVITVGHPKKGPSKKACMWVGGASGDETVGGAQKVCVNQVSASGAFYRYMNSYIPYC